LNTAACCGESFNSDKEQNHGDSHERSSELAEHVSASDDVLILAVLLVVAFAVVLLTNVNAPISRPPARARNQR
jgi:hypothetical protein